MFAYDATAPVLEWFKDLALDLKGLVSLLVKGKKLSVH
jgi:hypothetical protein